MTLTGPLTEENKKRSLALLNAWSEKDPDALDRVVGEGWIDHDPHWPFPELRGPRAARAALQMYCEVFPDLRVTVAEVLADGDKVICRWTFAGTQTGDLPDVPATGRKFSVEGITVDRHEDGKLAESWSAWDALGFFTQIGANPPTVSEREE
ncbi:ester cyclase [Streptomyces sp. NPDC054796]